VCVCENCKDLKQFPRVLSELKMQYIADPTEEEEARGDDVYFSVKIIPHGERNTPHFGTR